MSVQTKEPGVRIKIIGIGGGGNNAVERMLETNIPMVDYVTINTDDGSIENQNQEVRHGPQG